jgi:hypothetical protein
MKVGTSKKGAKNESGWFLEFKGKPGKAVPLQKLEPARVFLKSLKKLNLNHSDKLYPRTLANWSSIHTTSSHKGECQVVAVTQCSSLKGTTLLTLPSQWNGFFHYTPRVLYRYILI